MPFKRIIELENPFVNSPVISSADVLTRETRNTGNKTYPSMQHFKALISKAISLIDCVVKP